MQKTKERIENLGLHRGILRELRSEDFEMFVDFLGSLSEQTNKYWDRHLKDPRSRAELFYKEDSFKLIFDKKRIEGFGYLFFDRDYPDTPSLGIVVRDACQGQGIGNRLMDALINEAKDRHYKAIYLTTFKENKRALALYLKKGFNVVSSVKNGTSYALRLVLRGC